MLEQYYFKDGVTEVSTRKVWHDMGSYLYFERLVSASVFCETVRQGVVDGLFGYARGKAEDGKYVGFACGDNPGMPGVSDSERIIKDTAAKEYKNGLDPLPPPPDPDPIDPKPDPVPPPTPAKKKFVGEVRIDTSSSTSKIAEVVDEVISHLSGIGANVKVTMTIEAKSVNPFAPDLVRTVGENAHNLNFVRAEFS